MGGDSTNIKRPLIITASLAVSLFIFTLLLKASTLLINIPPGSITVVSGVILITLGILTLFPALYARAINGLGLENRAQNMLGEGAKRRGIIGPIIIGAALGPVFSSCSPVYAYLVATVLPIDFTRALISILAYILGLAVTLLIISYFGQRAIKRFRFAVNPKGWFQRGLGILFILVGLLVASGSSVGVQAYVSDHTPFNLNAVNQALIPAQGPQIDKDKVLNVKPYDAPELTGLQEWINSDPQTIAGLKGKVVYVDFWTYSCINCVRNNPHLEKLYEQYKESGFTILGIHAPEFSFEKLPANVRKAAQDQKITYPIALDNDFDTWNAFKNNSWPAGYLIDADGKVRRVHTGEGEYVETEQAVRSLLTEAGKKYPDAAVEDGGELPISKSQTPETYLGSTRASDYVGSPALAAGSGLRMFTSAATHQQNQWDLSGQWDTQPDQIVSGSNAKLHFTVSAKEVYLVAGATTPQQITVLINGQPVSLAQVAGSDVTDSQVTIGESKLYRLVSFPELRRDQQLELQVPSGVTLNVFTFGG
jgi:cytochrome c biogenesis protein CcdA/thiol-disulfide isomerase/thioredoxin